jgi:hypothetical protein
VIVEVPVQKGTVHVEKNRVDLLPAGSPLHTTPLSVARTTRRSWFTV